MSVPCLFFPVGWLLSIKWAAIVLLLFPAVSCLPYCPATLRRCRSRHEGALSPSCCVTTGLRRFCNICQGAGDGVKGMLCSLPCLGFVRIYSKSVAFRQTSHGEYSIRNAHIALVQSAFSAVFSSSHSCPRDFEQVLSRCAFEWLPLCRGLILAAALHDVIFTADKEAELMITAAENGWNFEFVLKNHVFKLGFLCL